MVESKNHLKHIPAIIIIIIIIISFGVAKPPSCQLRLCVGGLGPGGLGFYEGAPQIYQSLS